MNRKEISADQLFAMANTKNSGEISIEELTHLVTRFGQGWTIKDQRLIKDYLDVDKNGVITKKEFLG